MKLRVKMWKHFCLINRHKWNVFKLMCRAGRPLQGALHDMSKFTPTEFIESAKYYTGTHSPIEDARKEIGYSKAWQHHKAHNNIIIFIGLTLTKNTVVLVLLCQRSIA